MSALEIIEQIKALPLEEKVEVAKFVQQLDLKAAASTVEPRYMDEASFATAKQKVFTKHSDLLSKLAQ
ncbi:MAG: hypothetical protein FJ398_08485 [Verrucomicrobia bacterium]|nr:hypothetical protein [Verrucomicrobiota bacterium]